MQATSPSLLHLKNRKNPKIENQNARVEINEIKKSRSPPLKTPLTPLKKELLPNNLTSPPRSHTGNPALSARSKTAPIRA
jgi:hypothetical protein